MAVDSLAHDAPLCGWKRSADCKTNTATKPLVRSGCAGVHLSSGQRSCSREMERIPHKKRGMFQVRFCSSRHLDFAFENFDASYFYRFTFESPAGFLGHGGRQTLQRLQSTNHIVCNSVPKNASRVFTEFHFNMEWHCHLKWRHVAIWKLWTLIQSKSSC